MKVTMLVLSVLFYAFSCRMVNISNDLLEIRTEEYSLEKFGTISFNNTNGDLELSEWDNNFVQVETCIYGDSSKGVPEDLNILIDDFENELAYTVEYPGGLSFVSVDFKVMVPEDSEYLLNSVTVNGETVVDARLDAMIESVNGDITVDAMKSRGMVTVNGDVSAILENQLEGFSLETVNGDLALTLPVELGIDIETVHGDVTIDGQDYNSEVSIRGISQAVVMVETVNGDIDIIRMN